MKYKHLFTIYKDKKITYHVTTYLQMKLSLQGTGKVNLFGHVSASLVSGIKVVDFAWVTCPHFPISDMLFLERYYLSGWTGIFVTGDVVKGARDLRSLSVTFM